MSENVDRRDFLKRASTVGAGLALAGRGFAATGKINPGRIVGANDRINVGLIGCGGRGSYVGQGLRKVRAENNNACQIVAVCDVYDASAGV